ncbi:MAG: hypothetical protein ACI4ET_10900 [Bilifractor sp.]
MLYDIDCRYQLYEEFHIQIPGQDRRGKVGNSMLDVMETFRLQGEDKVKALIHYLLQNGREEDIRKAVNDKDWRQKLYQEIGIQ